MSCCRCSVVRVRKNLKQPNKSTQNNTAKEKKMVQKAKTRIASIFSILLAFLFSFFTKSPIQTEDTVINNSQSLIGSAMAADGPGGILNASQPNMSSPVGVLNVTQPDSKGNPPAGVLNVTQPDGELPAGLLNVTQPDGSTAYLSVHEPGSMLSSSPLGDAIDTEHFPTSDFEDWLASKEIAARDLSELQYAAAAAAYRDEILFKKLLDLEKTR